MDTTIAESAADAAVADLIGKPIDYKSLDVGLATIFEAEYALGKQFSLKDGALIKRTLGALGTCSYRVASFDGVEDFAQILASLTPRQVMSASTPRGNLPPTGRIATKENVRLSPGCITRGKEHFGLQRGLRGLLTIDYDPEGEPLPKARLWEILREVVPGVDQAGVVHWVSGSSLIFADDAPDAVMLQGVRGQRVYILVADVGDLPRAMTVLQKRLWLAGHGRIQISAAGSLLRRTLADATLSEDARLDFVGGAVLRDGLQQRRHAPEILSRGGWLDTAVALPDLTASEEHEYLQALDRAERAAMPEAQEVRDRWVAEHGRARAQAAIGAGGDYAQALEAGQSAARAALAGTLLGDWVVELDDGEQVSVGEILDDRPRFHGRMTRDPVEPGYCGGHLVGHLNLFSAAPNLYSHAHGGRAYRLARQPDRIMLESGRTALNAAEYVRRMASSGELFAKGGVPVRILNGVRPLGETSAMALELGTRFAAFRRNQKGDDVPADPSDSLVRQVIRAAGAPGGLPELVGYVRHPFVTETEIVATPGFHTVTGTFAEFDPGDYAGIPAAPSREEVIAALVSLWGPWSRFAFATPNDRAAALSAILGIVCRPGIDLAPGVLVDAPVPGSGKTFLASSLGALSLGALPDLAVFAHGETDVELKKRLIADCIGGGDVFVYDNVIGHFNSAVLAGVLTTGRLKDRILSQSANYAGPGPRHVFVTANNLTLGPDLAVRFLRIRLDHGVASPATLQFDFLPAERVLAERADVLRACLVVMRAFQVAGSPHHGQGGYRMAAWDRLIRSAVIWLGRQGYAQEAGIYPSAGGFDPAAGLLQATADVSCADEVKIEFFERLHALIGDADSRSAGDLHALVWTDQRAMSAVESLLNGRPLTRATLRNLLDISIDQIAGGFRLRKSKSSKDTWLYWVQKVA